MEKEREYITGHIPLVAFLRLQGHRCFGIEETDINHFEWIFADSDILQNDIDTYMAGEALVDPKGFSQQISKAYRELSGMKPKPGQHRLPA